MSSLEVYKTKDVNGLRLVKGILPIDKVGDILVKWAHEGYTDACKDLAKIYKCDYVAGSQKAINQARLKHNLPPAKFPKNFK